LADIDRRGGRDEIGIEAIRLALGLFGLLRVRFLLNRLVADVDHVGAFLGLAPGTAPPGPRRSPLGHRRGTILHDTTRRFTGSRRSSRGASQVAPYNPMRCAAG